MVSMEESRRRKEWLQALAVEMDAHPRPLPQRPERPAVPFSIRSYDDDEDAQTLITLHRAASSDAQLKKPFSVRQSLRLKSDPAETPDPNMIFAVLEKHIADGGHPATTEALVNKLIEAGGDVNLSRVTKKTIRMLGQPKYQPAERSRILRNAIKNEDNTLTSILIPYADQRALNDCLAKAVRIGRMDYIRQLLSYGAALESSGPGEEALRQLCMKGRHSETVGLLVACHPEMTGNFAGSCLTGAVDAGCLETVVVLVNSRSYFGDRYSIALEKAIRSSRVDMIVAMTNGIGLKHTGYDAACGVIFKISDTPSGDMRVMLEVLLCAGANGPNVARGLLLAVKNENDDLLDLLLRYGAPVSVESAAAIRHVLENKRFETAKKLLAPGVDLSARLASHCLASIPHDVTSDVRSTFVGLLMAKGASGDELAKCLVHAVNAGDTASMELMFGYGSSGTESKFHYSATRASVDYNNGEALIAAIKTRKPELIQTALLGGPSELTLAAIIPTLIAVLGKGKELEASALTIIRLVLKYSHTTYTTNHVLTTAVDSIPADERDPRLVSLVTEERPPFRYLRDLLALAVKNENAALVDRLLEARQQTHKQQAALSAAFTETLHVNDHAIRLRIMRLLLAAGAHQDASAVFDVLMHILSSPRPLDLAMVRLLVDKGQVDVSRKDGAAIVIAVKRHTPDVLRILVEKRTATNESITRGLSAITEMKSTKEKVNKLNYLLAYPDACDKALATKLLRKEIQSISTVPASERVLGSVSVLVNAGADLSASLCLAIELSLDVVVNLLLAKRPAPAAVGPALLAISQIHIASNRHRMARLLLQTNPPEAHVLPALKWAIGGHPVDSVLVKMLAEKAGPEGAALTAAMQSGHSTAVAAVMQARDTDPSSMAALQSKALQISEKNIRQRTVSLIADASAATLPTHASVFGAIPPNESMLVSAARQGVSGTVRQLLDTLPTISPAAATEAFRAAAQLDDVEVKLDILRMLVGRNVDEKVVSQELVACAGLGKQGRSLAKILLAHGANINYNDGEALVSATIAGNLNVVGTLLGMDLKSAAEMSKISWASQDVLVSTLDVAWLLPGDERYRVLSWLFGAGLAPGDVVNERLRQAVAEPTPDKRLVRLLFKRGASAASEGYKAILSAATRDDDQILDLCLEYAPVNKNNSNGVLTALVAHIVDHPVVVHNFTQAMYKLLGLLCQQNAMHANLGIMLRECVAHSSDNKEELVKQVVRLLLTHGVSADYAGVLGAAVNAGNVSILDMILDAGPSAETLNAVFPCIFQPADAASNATTTTPCPDCNRTAGNADETKAVAMVKMFRRVCDPSGNPLLDPRYSRPLPVLYSALLAYPASTELAQALVDAGFDANVVLPDDIAIDLVGAEEKGISVLAWAIGSDTPISSKVIRVLVQGMDGASIDKPTPIIGCTPLMVAVRKSRPKVVQHLLAAGADATIVDWFGRPPVEVAFRLRKPCWDLMVNAILSTGQHRDDGLLHDAACRLDPVLVQAFLNHGYDANFASPKHGGRTVLGELCLCGLGKYETEAEVNEARTRRLAVVVAVLLNNGASTKIQCNGKSPLLLALENKHPVVMTRVLLEAGVGSEINESWNMYPFMAHIGGGHVKSLESPVKYTELHLQTDAQTRERLLEVLRNASGKDQTHASDV